MKLLNLGCGDRYHEDWVNIDFIKTGPDVIPHNLLKGIPFPDESFDAVYHSHVLEHIPGEKAEYFIKECYRVLKKKGVIRVAVPDLERIARNYLRELENVHGNNSDSYKYDWALLEMYDQVTRNTSGGNMKKYILESEDKDYIQQQIGFEAESIINAQRAQGRSTLKKLRSKPFSWYAGKVREKIVNAFVMILGGEDLHLSFKTGLFRTSGEVHQYMYDRYSLKRLLQRCGFAEIEKMTAYESSINDFNKYSLDIVNGRIRKPDSLFMEGRKL